MYGLDWVATVPPTAALCSQCFGRERSNVAFAWLFCAHQVGAAAASAGAGAARTALGGYALAFYASGGICFLASAAALRVGRGAAAAAAEERGGLVAAAGDAKK